MVLKWMISYAYLFSISMLYFVCLVIFGLVIGSRHQLVQKKKEYDQEHVGINGLLLMSNL